MNRAINRRGFLGALAAAPLVAAAAKPSADPDILFAELHGGAPTSGWVISEGVDFTRLAGPGGEKYAVLSDATVRRLSAAPDASFADIETRPQGGSHSLADGRSDARQSERSDGPHRAAVDAPAAAPDQPFDDDHPILKLARAC